MRIYKSKSSDLDSSVASLPQNDREKSPLPCGGDLGVGMPQTLADFESTLIAYDRAYFRLGFRDIARDTDERTLIFTLIPKQCGCCESVWQHIPKRYILNSGQIRTSDISHTRICFALGIFNSLIVDFLARIGS